MSNGRFVRLVFLKDMRRYLWPLGMVLALELTVTLFIHGVALYAMLAAISIYLIGLYLTMDVVQLDWPGRDLRFLFTRPVPGGAILFAKVLLLGLFLLLSGWGFKELDYAVLGMPIAPLDHLCLLIETTIFSGAAMAFVALLAILLRKRSQVFAAAGVLLMAIPVVAIAGAFFPGSAAFSPQLNSAQIGWDAVVALLCLSGLIGLVMIAALIRYRTRQFRLPLILVIAGAILGLFICEGAITIGENRLAHGAAGKMPPHLREQVRFAKDSSSGRAEQASWSNGFVYHSIIREPEVEGMTAPYYCSVVSSQSTARLRSGQIIHSIVDQSPPSPAKDIGDLMGAGFEAEVIGTGSSAKGMTSPVKPGTAPGVSPPSFSDWSVPAVSYEKPAVTLRAFTYLPSRLPAGEDLTGVTIKGEAQLEIHRAYPAGSIPVKSGTVFSQPRQRYQITGVSSWADRAGFQLTCIKLPLILRGDTGDSSENFSWALVSRPRNELLHDFSYSGYRTTFPVNIATSIVLYSRHGQYTPDNPPPIDWLTGAELVFLGNENCGEITVPYEVDNVTLTR